MMWKRLLAMVAGAALLSCSGDDSGPSQPEQDSGNTVAVGNDFFNPANLTVPVNTTVTWVWNSGGVAHNVLFTDTQTSGNRTSGEYPRTFTAAGTYPYICSIHGQAMSGVVTVTGSSTGGGGGGGGTGGGGTDDGGGGGGYGGVEG
jgi:plastocyanin